MFGRRKRYCFCVCVLPASLCCAYLLCVYSVYTKRILFDNDLRVSNDLRIAKDYMRLRQDPPVAGSNLVQNNQSFHNKKIRTQNVLKALTEEGEYLGGFRTDVDRTEDRKKKKRINKLHKGLKELCRKENDTTACQDLQVLTEKISQNKSFYDSNLIFESGFFNETGSLKDWNLYADRGLTIVGKKESLQRRLPQVLIIGAKKAGTRALLEFLRVHPSVTAAGAELHFFDRYFYRGPSWYRSKLPESLEGQVTVEKTPAYFVDKDVPQRVKGFIPTVKLLLIVRDPVSRAVSDYAQSLSKHELKRSFRDLVLKNATSGLVNVVWGPVRGGLYARHYQRWRKYFPSSSIHVVSGEGLVNNPAQEMGAVQEFIGIEKVINNQHFYFNATKGFPCLVKRERNGRPHCLGYTKGRHHPKVDEDALMILRDFYRPFNAKFYKLVGRDFGWP